MSTAEFDIESLTRSARGGNADAQYRLAALSIGQQQVEEGLTWLRKAAANNHRDARFTLANFYLRGEFVPQDVGKALTLIQQLHRAGYAAASQELSSMMANGFGMERDWAGALDILLDSALEGRVGAMRELALLLILSGVEDALAHDLLMAAATRNDIHSAMVLTARLIAGDERISRSAIAFWLAGAQELGYPLAGHYRTFIDEPASDKAPAHSDIPTFETKALKLVLLKPEGGNLGKHETLYDRPVIRRTDNAIPQELCDYIIGYAAPGLQPAAWFNPQSSQWEADPLRRCMTRIFLPIDQPLTITAVTARMTAAADSAVGCSELPTVLFYKPGQEYQPHLDVMPEEIAVSEVEAARGGQRVKTAVLYLNDTYSGGEIHFMRADKSLTPKKGAILVYDNLLSDGTIDEQALHEGKPVTLGEKWVMSLSIRGGIFSLLG